MKDHNDNADLVRQTSQLVAAYCQNLPIEPAELPVLIAYVGTVLRVTKPAGTRATSAYPRREPPARVRSPIQPGAMPRPGQSSAVPATNLVDLAAYRRSMAGRG